MQFEIFKYESVSSTNDVAVRLIKNKKKRIGFIYSKKQTKGRGTHGKKWISKEGNLFGTIFFNLKENYPSFVEFSIINPVIVSNVIKSFCKKKNVSIKWPNDIFVNGKKICGILQETFISDKEKFLIIGLGINIASNPKVNNSYKTTSILLETKKKLKIKEVFIEIINSYEKFFINLNSYSYTNFKREAESIALNQII